MKSNKKLETSTKVDQEIQYFIKQKKEENSALKKLLFALNNAKETNEKPDMQ